MAPFLCSVQESNGSNANPMQLLASLNPIGNRWQRSLSASGCASERQRLPGKSVGVLYLSPAPACDRQCRIRAPVTRAVLHAWAYIVDREKPLPARSSLLTFIIMLRRILAPLTATQLNDSATPPISGNGAGDVSEDGVVPANIGDGCIYRREPTASSAKDVTVGQPQNFRLLAHVACDPETGLYTGMDEFLTLAVSSKGQPPSSAPSTMDGDGNASVSASSFDTAAAVAVAFPADRDDCSMGKPRVRERSTSPGHSASDALGLRASKSMSGIVHSRSLRRGGAHNQPASVAAGDSAALPHRQGTFGSTRRPPKAPSSTISNVFPGLSPPKRKSPRKLAGGIQSSTRNLFVTPSMPTAVNHAVHVRLDPSNPTGFAGLPPAWENILLYSGIPKDEALQHPQELVDVLNFTKTPALDTPDVSKVASASGAPVTSEQALPPICFSFPRTPTVTSFDDGSEQGSELPPTRLAPGCAANSENSMAHIEASETTTHEQPRDMGECAEDSYRSGLLQWSRSGRMRSRSQALDGLQVKGEIPFSSTRENEQPLRSRSRSSAVGLAALASKCGANSSLLAVSGDSRYSQSEEEMQKVIGGDREFHLPECLPKDAASLEIRCDRLRDQYMTITKIGEGASGSVYSAVARRDGRQVALKKVKPANERDWSLYRYEVHVMQSHGGQENLVSCLDAFRESEYLYMVLELMSASLADVLERRRAGAFNRALGSSCDSVTRELSFSASRDLDIPTDGTSRIAKRKKSKVGALSMATGFEEDVIAYVCREVLLGLEQVHLISRVHRDIKSDNILVRPDGAVKVADFGFCAELQAGARNTVVGTPYQMAPEVIRGKDYGTPVDIWSAGVLAYELAEGAPPHEGLSPIRAMFKIATSEPPSLSEAWSPELRDFVSACCQIDQSSRPSAHEALQHPFLAQACSADDAASLFASLCSSADG